MRKYRERLDELRNTLEDLNKKGKRELKSLKPLPRWIGNRQEVKAEIRLRR